MKLDLSNDIDKKRAEIYFKKLQQKEAKIDLKEVKPRRSISQNSYLHVCFSIMALETGYNLEEIKVLLKRTYGEGMIYKKNGHKFLRSTADLNKEEITYFIDWLRDFSQKEFDCYIPTSQEYLENQFMIDKQYEHL